MRGMAAREHEAWIDWLKVLAVLGVFYYHTAQAFSVVPWLVSNPERSLVLSAVAGVGYLFGLPLLFVLAGAATLLALERRTPGEVAVLRLRRLLPPFILGVVILSPFQAWVSAGSGGPVASLPEFAVGFFGQMRLEWSPQWFGIYGYHLWFIGFLLLYSLIALPVIAWLRGAAGRRTVGWLAAQLRRLIGFAWLLVPLVAIQLFLRISFPGMLDWADFALWLAYFVVGFLIVADQRIVPALASRSLALFAVAVTLTLGMVPSVVLGRLWELERSPSYTLEGIAYLILRTAVTTAWVLAAVAIGARHLRASPRALEYASEAVLPFYVVHHPVVLLIAAMVITWPAGLWVKHLVIVAVSLAATLALYELLVRRIGPMRSLFGLGPLRPSVPADSAPTAPAPSPAG